MSPLGELMEANKTINAIVEWLPLQKKEATNHGQFGAQMPERPLADWTFAIKSNIAVRGARHTAGIGAFAQRIASQDAFCIARLREAGASIIGIANMEEAALGAVNDNPHFGRTENPLRLGFTPGGSSGGSAAAVAAGLVRAALGTDTMGSCRIPAAYCGLVGFKPSYGRVSTAGVEPLSRRLDHVGVLAQSVADATRVFVAVDVLDPHCADARSYPTHGHPHMGHLAVLDAASRSGLSPDVAAAYGLALDRLREHGWTLVERAVNQSLLARARRAGLLLCEAELANSLAPALQDGGEGLSQRLRDLIAFGASQSAPKLAAAGIAVVDTWRVLREQLDDVDAVCWPTAPQTAFAFSDVVPTNQADFTCLANFTGAPAISLPLPAGADTLPVGLQLMMPLGADHALLTLASTISAQVLSQPNRSVTSPSNIPIGLSNHGAKHES